MLKVLHPRAGEGIVDVEVPRRDQEYVDLTRIDPALRDTAQRLPDRRFEDLRRRYIPSRAAHRRDPVLARIRSLVRELRQRARPRHGPAAPADTTIFWEQGILDVLIEYPIQSDRSFFDPRRGSTDLRSPSSPRFASCRPPGSSASSSSKAIPASSGSIHAGTRPSGTSSCSAARHPRRHRPPAVLAPAHHPVPQLPHARPDRDRVHGRALDHADRIRLQARRRRCGFRR